MRVLSLSAYPMWDDEDRKGMPSIYLGQKAFVDAGHEVMYAFPGRQARAWDYDGIRMHQFRFRFPVFPERLLTLHRLSVKLHYLVFVVVATLHGVRICRRYRPDVIYAHLSQAAPVAWVLGRLFRVPNITRMYGTFLYRYVHSWVGRLRKIEEVLAFTLPARYLIVTDDGTRGDECARVLGVPAERVRFWRNGVDPAIYLPGYDAGPLKDELGIPRGHKIILALSRLVNWKRVDRLVAALPGVLSRCPETTAVIVGDGTERPALEAMCDRLGVREHVRFVGQVLHADTPRYLNAADIFVSLYDVSNAGNPLLEALRCGRCIVTLDVGATRAVIPDDSAGVLLRPEELPRLADVLADLLEDDARRERLQQGALRRASAILQSWEQRTRMEVDLIERLVTGAPPVGEAPVAGGQAA